MIRPVLGSAHEVVITDGHRALPNIDEWNAIRSFLTKAMMNTTTGRNLGYVKETDPYFLSFGMRVQHLAGHRVWRYKVGQASSWQAVTEELVQGWRWEDTFPPR